MRRWMKAHIEKGVRANSYSDRARSTSARCAVAQIRHNSDMTLSSPIMRYLRLDAKAKKGQSGRRANDHSDTSKSDLRQRLRF